MRAPRLSISLHRASVRRSATWALREITWLLEPGQRWALTGDNGAGKTQLLKLLSGDVWPTPRSGAARSYCVGRCPVDTIEAKQRIAYLGAEQQDKYARYGWNLSVRDLIVTGLHRTDLLLQPAVPTEFKQVQSVLRACGLTAIADRQFLSLSYGQKRLALLARALAQNPDWLLLDELYNGLDANHRRRIDLVLNAARLRGQSWVATAHRAVDVPRGSDRLLELVRGRVSARKRISRTDTQLLTKRAAEHTRSTPARRTPARRTPARRQAACGPPLIELQHVDLFVDYRPVLRGVNWQLRRGEHWAIYGVNGAGKSSFLKLLYGDLSPALGGRIVRSDIAPGTPIAEWKRRVGYVSPELQCDYAVNVSVSDLVASGRYSSIGLADPPTAQDNRIADRWLRDFGLWSVANRRPGELSYGQLRRALIARAMAAEARILLLDEPLTGLDPLQRALMKRLLERLMRQVTVIAAVHHSEDLPQGMTHGLRLHNRSVYGTDSYSAT